MSESKIVADMLAVGGLYICGDTNHPEYLVPIWVDGGEAQSMKRDQPLTRHGFNPTFVVYSGPHVAPAFAPSAATPATRSKMCRQHGGREATLGLPHECMACCPDETPPPAVSAPDVAALIARLLTKTDPALGDADSAREAGIDWRCDPDCEDAAAMLRHLSERNARLEYEYSAVHTAGATASELAKRSTRRLAEMAEPGFIGAFAARDAAIERAEAAERTAAERGERLERAEKDAAGCICAGNWRQILSEVRHQIGKRFRDRHGKEWTFYGVVDGDDDYYYGMYRDGEARLLSCVGSIEGHGYTAIDAALAPAAQDGAR